VQIISIEDPEWLLEHQQFVDNLAEKKI